MMYELPVSLYTTLSLRCTFLETCSALAFVSFYILSRFKILICLYEQFDNKYSNLKYLIKSFYSKWKSLNDVFDSKFQILTFETIA